MIYLSLTAAAVIIAALYLLVKISGQNAELEQQLNQRKQSHEAISEVISEADAMSDDDFTELLDEKYRDDRQ